MKLPLTIAAALCSSLVITAAWAGGGPENVLLVVNSNSEASKTIANHYINWRRIPACNVVYIDWKESLVSVPAPIFRDKLFLPIFTALEERHLLQQIDYIVYSADFPWKVNMQPMFADQVFPPQFEPVASLNGATYLASLLFAEKPTDAIRIVEPITNWYVPGPAGPNAVRCQSLANVPSRGFRSHYLWDQNGRKTDVRIRGESYFLSMVLGVTNGRGNTLPEVLNYLRRAVAADGTHPRGTIYFVWNKDVRSLTRDKCFPAVAAQINAAGGHAVVQQGKTPIGSKDVAGMMLGVSDFDLTKDGISILPGAICEHLTSSGAIFDPNAGQTPISELLRHGAAGSSGTVAEPHALQAKFPLPSLQLHYVRGCSLAESFYQSVSGPYQLLIVGDPLCQPWANIPTITVGGVKPDEKVKGSISLTPVGPQSVGNYEIFVDGALAAKAIAGKPFPLDTTKLADGYHELRVVGARLDPIETQGRRIIPIFVNNHDAAVELKLLSPFRVGIGAKLKLSVRQPGAKAIVIRQNSFPLKRVEGESGEIEVSAATLGRGPTALQAFSEGSVPAASVPLRILVE